MAEKDPAFLFYPGDWQGGTSIMSRFIKGCYIDLLIAQFNHGHLSIEEIKTVLGSDFGQSWPTLQKKFLKTSDGNFYNGKLEREMKKRAEFSQSQSKRASKGWEKRKSPKTDAGADAGALPKIEDGNEIEIRNEIEDGNPKAGAYVNYQLSLEQLEKIYLADHRWIEITAKSKSTTKEEIISLIPQFKIHCETIKTGPKTEKDFARHFINWFEKRKGIVQNGKKITGGFPDHWDKNFEAKLPTGEVSNYWSHLRSLGLAPVKDRFKRVVAWERPQKQVS